MSAICANDSGLHFTVVASVEASSPLKVLSFIYYELPCMSFFIYHELYFMWTEFTMNDVEHYLKWTVWNYINVKWFERNLNKTVKCSNVNAVWSCLLGCQSTLAQEPSSSRPDGTVTLSLWIKYSFDEAYNISEVTKNTQTGTDFSRSSYLFFKKNTNHIFPCMYLAATALNSDWFVNSYQGRIQSGCQHIILAKILIKMDEVEYKFGPWGLSLPTRQCSIVVLYEKFLVVRFWLNFKKREVLTLSYTHLELFENK